MERVQVWTQLALLCMNAFALSMAQRPYRKRAKDGAFDHCLSRSALVVSPSDSRLGVTHVTGLLRHPCSRFRPPFAPLPTSAKPSSRF